jgi:tetrahydromethanopterin S-methyltransferase subunit G
MVKLPPVRKRQGYSDLSSDDLVFALFWDRALGDPGAMREDREMAPIVATKTLNTLLIRFKHGKHDQRSHGRRGARGRAAASAYQAARAGGASHTEARAAANNVSRAIAARQRLANVDKQLAGHVSDRQRSSLQAEKIRLTNEIGRRASSGNSDQFNAIVGADISPTVRGRAAPRKPATAPRTAAQPASSVPREKARAFENKVRLQDYESALVLDGKGKPILSKDGGKDYVNFSAAEVAQIRAAQGVVMTHNHPGGLKYPPGNPARAGNSFSQEDIVFATSGGVQEMRAVTPTRRYYVKAPQGGWDEAYHRREIAPRYKRYESDTFAEFGRRINEGSLTIDQANAEHYHRIWSKVFGDLGIEYGYTED